MAARTMLQAPPTARAGDVIEIRTLIGHPMETGFRPDAAGQPMPRDLIRRFTCRYGGDVVFAAELHAAVSANPFIAFHLLAAATGPIVLRWEGDNGFDHTETLQLRVD